MLKDLVVKNRSIRRFYQDQSVDTQTLRELVDLGRLSASGTNRQPLKYILVNTPERNAAVFACLAWARNLPNWPGPAEGERPAAYAIMLCDKEIAAATGQDHGIAAQSMLLGAAERGLGGCMIGNIQRDKLRQALAIPERYDILLVVAIGRPKEKVVLDDLEPGQPSAYWRDEQGVHHVPKRRLDDIILPL